MKKLISFMILIIVSLFLYNTLNNTSKSPNKYVLKVGYIPITDAAQLIVAKEKGIFKKNNIEVSLIPIGGGAKILQTLESGNIDIAFSNLTSVVYFEERIKKLKMLSGGTLMNKNFSEAGLVTKKTFKIKSILDLNNTTIAVNTKNNIIDLALQKIILKYQLKNIKIVELPFKDMEMAVLANHIDVATLPEPLLTKALMNNKLHNLGDHFVYAFKEIYGTGYFTLPKIYIKRKKEIELFNKSIKEITDKVNLFDNSVIETLVKRTKVPSSLLKKSGHAKFVKKLPDEALNNMKTWMLELGFLKK